MIGQPSEVPVEPFAPPWLNVFIDESGNADLDTDKSGSSRLFIVTAIIVDDEHLLSAVEMMDRVAKRLANGGEIQSKRIRGRIERRLTFLRAI